MDHTQENKRENIEFSSMEENRQFALQLAQSARREILIASYDLDSRIYSEESFVNAISAMVRSHPSAHVHILVWKTNLARKNGHRLIDVMQRLSSRIRIHTPDPVHAEFYESYMVVDGTGYFRRPLADRFEGVCNFYAPLIARELKDQFHTMWERSTHASEFRRLGI